jgi:aspartate ammonia-lyase
VKEAAALANEELGLLEPKKAAAIVAACREIRDGKLHDQFIVDVIQGGAGTSTNMNANEVAANRALELLGYYKGQYQHLHPNEDVNLGQSTNDVYPTAVKVGLRGARSAEGDVGSAGRVRCQGRGVPRRAEDGTHPAPGRAVPMTLGQEFSAYATPIIEAAFQRRPDPAAYRRAREDSIPLRRLATP